MSGAPVQAQAPLPTLNFRDKLANNLPAWLNGPNGSRWVYPWGFGLDAMADAATFGIFCGYATQCPPDALPWVAVDRQVDRGFNEPEESYRARLRLWLDLWRRAGSAESVLVAVAASILPLTADMRTVSNDSAWDTIAAGAAGPPVHVLTRPRNWDWDSYVYGHSVSADPDGTEYHAKWWRAWVIIYAPAGWTKGKLAGGGAKAGDGTVAGLSITADEARTIRQQVQKWAPAHTWCPAILVSFDSAILHPDEAYPSLGALPDGRFKWYGCRASDAYIPVRALLGFGYSGANAVSYIAGFGAERYGT